MVYYDMDGQVLGSDALMSETCPKPLSGNTQTERLQIGRTPKDKFLFTCFRSK